MVDEVQMVGDPGRGASFTRAVLGLPAATLHVCGDPAVLPLLRLLVQDAGALPSATLNRRWTADCVMDIPVMIKFAA